MKFNRVDQDPGWGKRIFGGASGHVSMKLHMKFQMPNDFSNKTFYYMLLSCNCDNMQSVIP